MHTEHTDILHDTCAHVWTTDWHRPVQVIQLEGLWSALKGIVSHASHVHGVVLPDVQPVMASCMMCTAYCVGESVLHLHHTSASLHVACSAACSSYSITQVHHISSICLGPRSCAQRTLQLCVAPTASLHCACCNIELASHSLHHRASIRQLESCFMQADCMWDEAGCTP